MRVLKISLFWYCEWKGVYRSEYMENYKKTKTKICTSVTIKANWIWKCKKKILKCKNILEYYYTRILCYYYYIIIIL